MSGSQFSQFSRSHKPRAARPVTASQCARGHRNATTDGKGSGRIFHIPAGKVTENVECSFPADRGHGHSFISPGSFVFLLSKRCYQCGLRKKEIGMENGQGTWRGGGGGRRREGKRSRRRRASVVNLLFASAAFHAECNRPRSGRARAARVLEVTSPVGVPTPPRPPVGHGSVQVLVGLLELQESWTHWLACPRSRSL